MVARGSMADRVPPSVLLQLRDAVLALSAAYPRLVALAVSEIPSFRPSAAQVLLAEIDAEVEEWAPGHLSGATVGCQHYELSPAESRLRLMLSFPWLAVDMPFLMAAIGRIRVCVRSALLVAPV